MSYERECYIPADEGQAVVRNASARIECFRMPLEAVRELPQLLEAHEAVSGIGWIARKSAGGLEFGEAFNAIVANFLAQYAGTKVLDFVLDLVKEWYKHSRSKEGFITLHLNGTGNKAKVGKGKRRRREEY